MQQWWFWQTKTDCRVLSSPRANLRMTKVPYMMLKLWVAIHSIECAWCCLHCPTSQGPYSHVVLAWEHHLGYLYIITTFLMHNCSVCLLLIHMHAAQVTYHFPMHACNQQNCILTGCIWLQQPPVRVTSSVNPFQGATETGVRYAAA